jgi:hypothetical protein
MLAGVAKEVGCAIGFGYLHRITVTRQSAPAADQGVDMAPSPPMPPPAYAPPATNGEVAAAPPPPPVPTFVPGSIVDGSPFRAATPPRQHQ